MTETHASIAPQHAAVPEAVMAVLSRSLADVVNAAPAAPARARVSYGDASIEVEWPVPDHAAPAEPSPGREPDRDLVEVPAPVVGVFYRAHEPGARPFVEVGDEIEVGTQVGIVEAMKLMNPILAEHAGTVTEIVAADASPVEYGQPLMWLRRRLEG
ncbi:acetyl-CoA carboxylase biotin carboxyl carrier protein [Amycolatopsis circi]|uniref:acetyl-CoA carboxylase biotin carboxyl carrier protein n=1 Tax=Amycolatopsis circi TaxID=871959 RepID=UPI000E279B8A|nr:biotin/lipoyl-containing protein [Amycolatopsis circi]